MRWWQNLALALPVAALAALGLAACGDAGKPAGPPPPAAWAVFRHLPGVVDLAGPRADGSFLVAAAGRLFVLERGGTLRPFARGAGGYQTAEGTEPYLTLAGGHPEGASPCPFGINTAFALAPGSRPGVVMISPDGRASRFADLPPGSSPSGIAFDGTGRFGHRLLVTAGHQGRTTVCDGCDATVAAGAPPMEGGIAVAPATFGRFGGDLIAPDEGHGLVYAVEPSGRVVMTWARPAVTSAWSRPGSSPAERALPTWRTGSRRATGILATTPSCGWPPRTWPGPGSGRATCWSPPRAARRPSTCGARRPAPSGTSRPGPRSPTPRVTSSSRRHEAGQTTGNSGWSMAAQAGSLSRSPNGGEVRQARGACRAAADR